MFDPLLLRPLTAFGDGGHLPSALASTKSQQAGTRCPDDDDSGVRDWSMANSVDFVTVACSKLSWEVTEVRREIAACNGDYRPQRMFTILDENVTLGRRFTVLSSM
jgi:hypothetical protein